MHIDAKPVNKPGLLLVVEYDAEAQNAFALAQPEAEAIWRDPQFEKLIEPFGELFRGRLSKGIETLRRFTKHPTRVLEISQDQLQASLEAAALASDAGIALEKDVPSLPPVVLLLAQIVELLTPLFSLPPTPEVFNRDEISPEVRDGFERLRHRARKAPAKLSVLQLYQVWFALAQLQPTNDQLCCLLHYLDQATELFRHAMQHQAVSAILSTKADKKSHHRRKV